MEKSKIAVQLELIREKASQLILKKMLSQGLGLITRNMDRL